MAVVVLGSVLVYSVYLPQTAPKQITLAVLPFSSDDEFVPLSVGFSAVLRDSIALSRDVAVVDTISTNLVMFDEAKASGMSHILALTHFVDGEVRWHENGTVHVDYRLVNVSQPNWKEVATGSLTSEADVERPWQDVRDTLTKTVRSALYDNSLMRFEPNQAPAQAYRDYLAQVGSYLLATRAQKPHPLMHDEFDTYVKELFKDASIATEPKRALWHAEAQFLDSLNVDDFASRLWTLAGEYPNSLAVRALAQLAFDLEHKALAEHAWLRFARIYPQSANVALNIANVRRLNDDFDGVEKAFRIAALRSLGDEVDYFKATYDRMSTSGPTVQLTAYPVTSALLNLQDDRGNDSEILAELRMHDGSFGVNRGLPNDAIRLWRQPPKFMASDDPRWSQARVTLHRRSPVASARLRADPLAIATEEGALEALFAPRRPE